MELLPREPGKPSAGAPAAAAENPLKKHAVLVVLIVAMFVVATILRYLWLSWRALGGRAPEAADPAKVGSGI